MRKRRRMGEKGLGSTIVDCKTLRYLLLLFHVLDFLVVFLQLPTDHLFNSVFK